jgi:inner membrane protein
MSSLKTNIYVKILAIFFIAMMLLIPSLMILGLISEREATQNDAIREVSSKWGEAQTLSGPFLTIPYTRYLKEFSGKDSVLKIVPVKEYLHILPNELNVKADITPEKRNRGIYEIVVYNAKVKLSGNFSEIDFSKLDIPLKDIHFDKTHLTVGISDLRGIERQISLKWNGNTAAFNPGVVSAHVVSSGINAEVEFKAVDSLQCQFGLEIDLKGSQYLHFVPLGKTTDVSMQSTWANPSFNGAFLPDKRDVSEQGFTANWNILHLNRNFPQMWTENAYSVHEAAFGADLLLPVDNYQKSYRSAKYAILFIGFTFLVFFFIEVMNRIFIHPVQYILVGIALVVFFTLLLALSEHIPFNSAYFVSVAGTLFLVVGYVKAILKSWRLSGLIGGMTGILYGFIFVVIQLQDFALLMGSVGIFIILGLVMYFSRKIDWYNLNLSENENRENT